MKKDVRFYQNEVLSCPLYKAVVDTELALRSKTDYDLRTIEDRQFAILCYALWNADADTDAYNVLSNLLDRAGV